MYYPKSQIIENLYTNGGELKPFNSEKEYKGYYFRTSNGETFSGKNPSDKPNIPLDIVSPGANELSSPSSNINFTDNNTKAVKYTSKESEPLPDNYYITNDSYYKAKSISTNRGDAPRKPIQSKPLPNEEDYKNGQFIRYFVKKSNENIFVEINKDEYELFKIKNIKVQFNLYVPIQIPWNLTGDRTNVFNNNKSISNIYETRDKLYGFSLSFKNKFDKYYRNNMTENLVTDGTEFKIKKTGKNYTGLYHIHPSKGPMVGAKHINSPHDYLVPIKESQATSIVPTGSIERSGGYSGGY